MVSLRPRNRSLLVSHGLKVLGVLPALAVGAAGCVPLSEWSSVAMTSELGQAFFARWVCGIVVSVAGVSVFRIFSRSSHPRSSSLMLVLAACVFVTLWWFPLSLDTGHRDAYFRSVLRLPATMWAILCLLLLAVKLRERWPAPWGTRGCELLLILTATALPLLGVETYFRWTVPTNAAGASDICTQTWLYLYHPRSSANGGPRFRDAPEPLPKRAGEKRILFVGDSITYGWGVDREEDLMSRGTEQILRQSLGDHVLTGNIGYFNVDTQQERRMLRVYGFAWLPDCVVLVHDLSDITGEAGQPPSNLRKPHQWEDWLSRHSFAFSRWHWSQVYRSGLHESHADWLVRQYNDPKLWAEHQAALDGVIADCRKREIQVLLVLAPIFSAVNHYPEGLREVHRRLAEAGQESSARVLDGLDVFAGTRASRWMVNRADRHPNEAAHRRLAEAIAPVLFKMIENPRQ